MGLDPEEDKKRRLVELNMRAARKRQSPQTGFVHHCYESDNDRHETIPLFENFCFVLALLRSKQSDNMLEGIALLQKLLCFEQKSHFPIYLHEFPSCKDRMLGIKLLPVFHAVLFDFYPILDSALQNKLQELIGRILSYGYNLISEGSLPTRYAAMIKAYAEPEHISLFEPTTPEHMAEALLAAHMAKCRGANPSVENVIKNWHPQLLTFTGPQEQERSESKPTLFDLFMSDYSRNYPARVLKDHPIHLRASLVYSLEPLAPLGLQSASLCNTIPYQSLSPHPRQPYTLYWGSCAHLHTLVCDPKELQCRINAKSQGAEFFFTSERPVSQDAPIELAFFYNIDSAHTLLVNGQKASAFHLGDVIEIYSDSLRFSIIFTLIEGDGDFYGHLSRGNRPLQIAAKGVSRYEAYDWQIGIRSIRRSDRCAIHALLTWDTILEPCAPHLDTVRYVDS